MQGIALATRKAKSYGVNGASWREEARARAAEHGLGDAELASLHSRAVTEPAVVDLASIWTRLSGEEGLTGMHNTFVRRHALAEIAGLFDKARRSMTSRVALLHKLPSRCSIAS
jgi:hypothetical protein